MDDSYCPIRGTTKLNAAEPTIKLQKSVLHYNLIPEVSFAIGTLYKAAHLEEATSVTDLQGVQLCLVVSEFHVFV